MAMQPRKPTQKRAGQPGERLKFAQFPDSRDPSKIRTRVQLPDGRWVSPEYYFVRYGKKAPGLDEKKSQDLMKRFLSQRWYRGNRSKEGRTDLPLPTYRQRREGGRLPMADLAGVETQLNFALSAFTQHLAPGKRRRIGQQLRSLINGRMLSANEALKEKTRTNLRQMWEAGKELLPYLRDRGHIYRGLMQDTTGRTYLPKGWSSDENSRTAPIHEAVHALWKLGAIRIDVPFAQAADRLYGLERGFFGLDRRVGVPTAEEFDRRPGKEIVDGKEVWREPNWADDVGSRIGQWVYRNLPARQRWDYLYSRCMGKSHRQALDFARNQAAK